VGKEEFIKRFANLVLWTRSEFDGFAGKNGELLGVLEHLDCGFGNADCGILK
jgi:hypothetical protein